MRSHIVKITTLAVATMMLLAGCTASAAATGAAPDLTAGTPATELRLGYFATVTHAPALIGVREGLFARDLADTKLSTQVFTAGPAAIEALNAGAIDATFIGPNPSINTFIQSVGASARIVSGATIGGAALVVREGIASPKDLAGTTLATPQLGNTQDVALRSWLKGEGYPTDLSGGGDVKLTPTDNPQTLSLFSRGSIDGAWLPEPWVSRLILETGAKVLVDEADLWPGGVFPTTVLLVRADYLAAHPETVAALVQGAVDSVAWLAANPDRAPAEINAQLAADTGKPLSDAVLARALSTVTFSTDPHAETFQTLVADGMAVGTQKKGSIAGLFDLRLLNRVRIAGGQDAVSADGLGEDGS